MTYPANSQQALAAHYSPGRAFSLGSGGPQAAFGLHASHTSVAANRVIASGKIGL
jgi:hypothetical protein